MSDVQFFQTRMGQRYYEHTLPELVRHLARIAEVAERLAAILEAQPHNGVPSPSTTPTDEKLRR